MFQGQTFCKTCKVYRPNDEFRQDRRAECKTCKRVYDAKRYRSTHIYNGLEITGPKTRIRALRNSAKRRGLGVEINIGEVMGLTWRMICHYCGGRLNPTGSAIDRKDSAIGYVLDNCVACCGPCNHAKGALILYDEFVHLIANRKATGWMGWPESVKNWNKQKK